MAGEEVLIIGGVIFAIAGAVGVLGGYGLLAWIPLIIGVFALLGGLLALVSGKHSR